MTQWNHKKQKWSLQDEKGGPDGKVLWFEEEKKLYIYVNGSNDYSDWVRNFQIRKRKVGDYRLNRVDRKEALTVIRFFQEYIEKANTITVEGYSRGAAIALQILFELHKKYPQKIVSGTFLATKRTGNRTFVEHMESLKTTSNKNMIVAYRQRGDLVPFLPPFSKNVHHIVFGKIQWPWWAHRERNYGTYKSY